ncbi:Rossmann-fold NAD(P)-binding domain-containing protein [Arenibacterium sp. CAU 1754]
MQQTVLILGASGRFGRNAALAFEAAGWTVRRFDRARDDLSRAAWGADVIVNGWNPLYPDWQRQVPMMTQQVIRVARQTGATVVIPGNVYVFGEGSPDLWSQTTPHGARNSLGKLRIDMERAYAASGVKTIVLRAGDYIDTGATGNWFDKVLIRSLNRGVFTYPGDPDVPHAWAYLPDVARAVVDLAEMRDSLPVFSDIPFPGYTLSGRQLAAVVDRITPQTVRLKHMSWLPVILLRPVWGMARYFLEMRYLWSKPHALDETKFRALLPDFRDTPVETAVASALPEGSVDRQVHPDEAVSAGR